LLVDVAVFMGASGAVPGLANVDPAGYVRLYRAAGKGDWEGARIEQERLFRLFSIVRAAEPGRMSFGSSALGAFKTALMLRGVIEGNVVGRPQIRLNEEEVERVRIGLRTAGLIQ
jgi:4-hydroxy-tetrahydrodipicolinate synthase